MSQLALDEQQGNRQTRQVVVYSLCGLAWLFCITICVLALRSVPIPDPLDRLATFVIGNISGMLIKTAADKVIGSDPLPVVGKDGGPVSVKDSEEIPEEEEKA